MQIKAKALEQKLLAGEDVIIIDVREAVEVAKGKIPEAIHIPLGDITDQLNELDKGKHYYVICTRGARSGEASDYLNKKGYKAVNVIDGMLGWEGQVE